MRSRFKKTKYPITLPTIKKVNKNRFNEVAVTGYGLQNTKKTLKF